MGRFEFESQPAAAAPSAAPAASASPAAEQKIEVQKAAKVSPVKTAVQVADEQAEEGDLKRRKTVIYDDDEEDDAPVKKPSKSANKPPVASKPTTKKAKIEESEDEWDGQDSDNASASGASLGDDSFVADESDESSGESEDDELFNSDSEEEISKKRPRASKPPLPPKSGGSATKSARTSLDSTRTVTPAKSTGNRVLIPFEGSAVKTPGSASSQGSNNSLSAFKQSNAQMSPHSRGASPFFGSTPSTPGEGSVHSTNSGANTPSTQHLNLPEGVVGRGSHEHNSFSFLFPENRRDASGIKLGEPGFNPRTVQVPSKFLAEQTPAMSQWWQFKAANMDTVLFFKVGKFYELFHMDADIGFAEIDLIYMKGTKAHSGFPEVSYGKYASQLVAKGYRVARVEQTETPEMLKERNDSGKGKKDKVVAREMCSVMSKGTRTYCHLDDLSLLDSDDRLSSSVLCCVKEVLYTSGSNNNTTSDSTAMDVDTPTTTTEPLSEYGVCIVDTVLCTITLAQFQDDRQRSRLRTLLARYRPNEILLETEHHSAATAGVVQLMAPKAVVEYLLPEKEMYTAGQTIKIIQKGQYYGKASSDTDSVKGWPAVLKAVHVGLEDGTSAVVCSALGGALWQLRRSLIDYEVLSLGKMYAYIPPDEVNHSSSSDEDQDGDNSIKQQTNAGMFTPADTENHQVTFDTTQEAISTTTTADTTTSTGTTDGDEIKIMTLDEVALTNLEILYNNYDRTEKGSLWAFVNHTKTAFGKRLLRSWLCHPLYRVNDIVRRQDAVTELIKLDEITDSVRALLKNVPDLERLLTRVHSNGLKNKGPIAHPDTRAILYENYNTRKIRDFADVLSGFETLLKVHGLFKNSTIKSPLLQLALHDPSKGGKFPQQELHTLLAHFRTIFDEKQAKKDGNIQPKVGMNQAYDTAKADIASIEADLETYLREMKKAIGVSDLKYWGSNKDRYQIEVPIALTNRVPSDWVSKSQKKTHRRFWTSTIEQHLSNLMEAEDRLAVAQKDTLREVFEKFDRSYAVWSSAISCVSLLDALCSVSVVSNFPNYVRPVVHNNNSDNKNGVAELNIVGGRHPMLEFSLLQRGEGDCIPNDLRLGGAEGTKDGTAYLPRMLLLSGPNMGGKSTLLRQTCLIAVLAQIGCFVPADSCVMTPVDRIFTRVGASDRILAGQSTFFVELAETATILSQATKNSLCILDELGRGTATFDGTAIAHAVVEHLVSRKHCRALFATHYHSLVNDWALDPRVMLGHMDCLVQSGDEGLKAGEERGTEEVTFLYKLSAGSSPRSYGINVARLAGLPAAVIELALKQSRAFEDRMLTAQASNGGGSVVGHNGTSGSCAKLTADQVSAVFERLVSLAQSTSSVEELAFVAAELWRRFESIRSKAV
eukprot:gene12451-14405_t